MAKQTQTRRQHNLDAKPRFGLTDHWHRLVNESIETLIDYLNDEEPWEQVERAIADMREDLANMPDQLEQVVCNLTDLCNKLKKEK